MQRSRPKTMREIQAEKTGKKSRATLTITNVSKQVISMHLNAPKNVDFFVGSQDMRLRPGQTYAFPKSRLRNDQVERLQKMGKISVVSDSEAIAEQAAV